MERSVIRVTVGGRQTAYGIVVGPSLIKETGAWAKKCLGKAPSSKILIVSNRRVFNLYGETVSKSLASAGFRTQIHLIGDGERFKNIETLVTALDTLSSNGFTRTDAILALGGGVVGDLAGFAASVYQRGIRFLQVPTTLLAMIDSSVGGKTAINSRHGKNLIGSFYQPAGVMVDVETLRTLPRREVTAGFCEAIKHGILSGKPLLSRTAKFLRDHPIRKYPTFFTDSGFLDEHSRFLRAQIAFKSRVVRYDEKESPADTSARSRKVLNLGHTFAHALEKATDYRYLKHGEAVGHGIRFALALSKRLELIAPDEVDLLNDVVHRAGFLPAISHIDPSRILEAFRFDKKQIGDSLQWILLRGIGKPVIFPDTKIPRRVLTSTVRSIIDN